MESIRWGTHNLKKKITKKNKDLIKRTKIYPSIHKYSMGDIYDIEQKDGVRCVWNNIPPTKLAATRSVVPIGVHYTPYKELDPQNRMEYEALRCRC